MSDDKEFKANRADCIGGSDVPDLLGLEPYGCERKLWYDKKGVAADFPFEGNLHTRRGKLLEAIAIDEFCREFSYVPTTKEAPAQIRHRKYKFMASHVDRFLAPASNIEAPASVLEMKIPTTRNFLKVKAEGPGDAWVSQAKWNLMISELHYGDIGVFDADRFVALRFPVRSDPNFESQMIVIANAFWESVQYSLDNPHPKKPDDYRACFSCPWRTQCKGMGRTPSCLNEDEKIEFASRLWVQDDEALELIEAYQETKDAHKEAEEAFEMAKAALEKFLDGRSVVTATGHRAYMQTTIAKYKAKPAVPAEEKKRVSLKVIFP